MTKITIEVDGHDLCNNRFGFLKRVEKAYKKAKEKEIKVGDWIWDEDYRRILKAQQWSRDHKQYTKLPQNLQDGLNEFLKSIGEEK